MNADEKAVSTVKPEKKAAPKPANKGVLTVSPDGREYITSKVEAERLNRTAGYKIKN